MSREYTENEVREMFIKECVGRLKYWKNSEDAKTIDDKMSGMLFSIFALIDGVSGELPAFILAPDPHEDDKDYAIDNGENYYPQNTDVNVVCDIGGALHELLHHYEEKEDIE